MISVTDTTLEWADQRQLRVYHAPETGSTNDDAKAGAWNEGDEPVLYLTGHQTSGRGRGDNTWLDTGAGDCLLSTWSLAIDPAPQPITSPRVGLILFTAASRVWPDLSWGLKAPNDLYLAGHKIAGLLVETVSDGHRHRLLVGLGFNVANHPRRFATATHLTGALGHPPEEGDWFQFLDEWKQGLIAALPECTQPKLTSQACQDLKNALNANSARPFTVDRVSPEGDLVHSGGVVKWTEL
jgi:BirA family biotin operon repressor/biotin-[acetyl-CoA-carboxylase] ligase